MKNTRKICPAGHIRDRMANVAQFIAAFPGDPTNVSTSIFDAPLGAIIIDTLGGAPRFKPTGWGDNTLFYPMANQVSPTSTNIPAGQTGYVPVNSQLAVFGTFTISGSMVIAGEVRFGAWPF